MHISPSWEAVSGSALVFVDLGPNGLKASLLSLLIFGGLLGVTLSGAMLNHRNFVSSGLDCGGSGIGSNTCTPGERLGGD